MGNDRPVREKKKGKLISSPWTFLRRKKAKATTRALPSSATGTSFTSAHSSTAPFSVKNLSYATTATIVGQYHKNELSPLVLPFYDLIPLNRGWWGILLGLEQSGNLIDSHIDAWVHMLLDSRSRLAKWTVMNTNFFPFLIDERQGVRSVHTMVTANLDLIQLGMISIGCSSPYVFSPGIGYSETWT